jgi:hypothetical protein
LFLIGQFLKIFSSETAWPNEPKFSAPYPVLVKQFQRKTFLEIDPSETRIACGGYVC